MRCGRGRRMTRRGNDADFAAATAASYVALARAALASAERLGGVVVGLLGRACWRAAVPANQPTAVRLTARDEGGEGGDAETEAVPATRGGGHGSRVRQPRTKGVSSLLQVHVMECRPRS